MTRDITPETKIGQLLEEHPALEEVLVRMAPAFGRLRNPVLRRTVARVATLRQAASIGGVPLAKMINELRREAGYAAEGAAEPALSEEELPQPDWVDSTPVVCTLDARPLLDSGRQPVNLVLRDLRDLRQKECYLLITPFVPAPLVEMAREQGFEVWSKRHAPDLFHTYFLGTDPSRRRNRP